MQIVTNTARHQTWPIYIKRTTLSPPPKNPSLQSHSRANAGFFLPSRNLAPCYVTVADVFFPPDRPTLPIVAANVTQSRESPVLKQSVTVRLSRPAVLRALWDGTHILCDTQPPVPAAPLPGFLFLSKCVSVLLHPTFPQ